MTERGGATVPMTCRKRDIELTTRLTAYVTREEGAAELRISPSTWDDLVRCGNIPKPYRLGAALRWRWADVDKAISKGDLPTTGDEPFFREPFSGPTQKRGRHASA
jgi:predicted DNA-binding transcriptional regulator AlpA